MSKASYSDGYMQQLWRRAVKAHWGDRCARCGHTPVECHHIIKRRKPLLRNDWRNGIPLCSECHRFAETTRGRLWVESQVDMDYLASLDVRDAKQWLQERGISRREFDRQTVADLKAKISEAA